MFRGLFNKWTFDDWMNHILFIPAVVFLIYSFFFHGHG